MTDIHCLFALQILATIYLLGSLGNHEGKDNIN